MDLSNPQGDFTTCTRHKFAVILLFLTVTGHVFGFFIREENSMIK